MPDYAKQKTEVPKKKRKSLNIFGGKHKDSYTVNATEPSPRPMRKFSVPTGESKQVQISFIIYLLNFKFFMVYIAYTNRNAKKYERNLYSW